VERTHGTEALPFSCRQFPRLLLRDAQGWHVSLSAWCGTAAALIVAHPGGLAATHADAPHFLSIDHIDTDLRVHVEGLDAHDAWPPLLRPGVLAGVDPYARWERRLLEECLVPVTQGTGHTGPALASALCWTDRLRQWRAADGAFFVMVGQSFPRRDSKWLQLCHSPQIRDLRPLLTRLMGDVPARWQETAWPAGLTDTDLDGQPVTREAGERALARYLGTRLIGSWVAYQGQGLRSVLASLVSAYALTALALQLTGPGLVTIGRLTSAIRASDWLLLHLLDREQWAAWCSEWEAHDDARGLVALVAAAHARLDGLAWAS
jgi:hypothetical protein